MNQVIEVNIADILSRLEIKIDSLDRKFETKIDKLEDKIDGLEKKFDDKINKLENKIDSLERKFDDKFYHLSNEVNAVKVNVAKLDEKITGVDKRLGNLEFIFRSIAGGIIITLILATARYFFPNIVL
ncbi:hypothetical protein ACN4EE_05950 [Geminocystis sp. CENA526]|uniref:hypothetical protein n=1 Tax=Geminocystis sp. CENA526 TaxID=1355871 RepID=UPI003D6F7D06